MEKVKNLINKNREYHISLLILIIAFGLFFRITCLNKFALTDDETYCYYLAKQAFPFGILKTIFNEDIHAPLYFFILHFWMKFFGESDIVIRLLSVVFGVLNIPVGYLVGKELLSKKGGLLIAAFISLNSFLIYYSQEVKFYSIIPLLVALSFLFLIRINNNSEKKPLVNYIGFAVSNLALLYTYTFGFIFVFFQAILFLCYFYFKKKNFKLFLYTQLITILIFLPYLIIFLTHHVAIYSKSFFDVLSWGTSAINFSNILVYIQDLFSLVPAYPTPNYLQSFIVKMINPIFFVVVVLPIIVYFVGITRSFIAKNAFIILMFLTGLFYISFEVILTLLGKFSMSPRYTIMGLVPFIITCCYGLYIIKNKLLKRTLVISLMVVSLLYLSFAPNSPQRKSRNGGSGIVASLLGKYNISTGDIVLLPPYGRSVNKYLLHSKIDNPIYFDLLRSNSIEMLLGKKLTASLNKDNSYDIFKDYVADIKPSEALKNYIKNNVIKKLDKSHYFIIVKDKDIAVFDRKQLNYLLLYVDSSACSLKKTQIMFYMLYSKALDDFVVVGHKYLKLVNIDKTDLFDIYIFKKV